MEVVQHFDNVTQWLEFLKTPVNDPALGQSSTEVEAGWQSEYAGFTRTYDLPAAIKLAEYGWEDGINRIEKMSAELSEDLVKILHVPEVLFDVIGDQLDMGRFVNGEPEEFMTLTTAEVEQEPRILHIVVNVTASGGVSTETMIKKGAAVVALVDILEHHGKRIIVDVMSRTEGRGQNTTTWVRVKDSDAPVQLANLVFTLAHPSTLRRLMFNSWEHLSHDERKRGGFSNVGGYGYVKEAPLKERGDIYVEGMDTRRRDWNPRSAQEWVLTQLSKQGIYVQKEEAV